MAKGRGTTLVAFAGLPGTGKSTLACRVARELDAPLLDKDRVREALFGPNHVDYTREQDDFVLGVLFQAVEHLAVTRRPANIVLDGRTYSRREQVAALRGFARERGLELKLIECTCSPEVAEERLRADLARGDHPAANRGVELYRALAALAEPIEPPKLTLRTDEGSIEALASACLAYAAPDSRT